MKMQSRAVRMTDDEWSVVKREAAKKGLTGSEYVRQAVAAICPDFAKLMPHACYICGKKYPWEQRYWQRLGEYYVCTECAQKIEEVDLSKMRRSR